MRPSVPDSLLLLEEKNKRPFYVQRSLPCDVVTVAQDNQNRSRLLPTDESYDYRNLALILHNTLDALRVLSMLVDEAKSQLIIQAVLQHLEMLHSIDTALLQSNLKLQTDNLKHVLSSVRETIIMQFKEYDIELKLESLLDLAMMVRQRRFLSVASDQLRAESISGTNVIPENLKAALKQVEQSLTADLLLQDGKTEAGKTALLQNNPFSPVVTYTTLEGRGADMWLLEQRAARSQENTLDNAAINEWKTLLFDVDGACFDWGAAAELKASPLIFESKRNSLVEELPSWFLSLQRDEQRFFIIELLQAQERGQHLDSFIQSNYSFQRSTFSKTPGLKEAVATGFRIYKRSLAEPVWDLYVDEWAQGSLGWSAVPVSIGSGLSKSESVRLAAQSMQQDLQQRAKALHAYYTELLGESFDSRYPIVLPCTPIHLASSTSVETTQRCWPRAGDGSFSAIDIYSEAMEVCNREAPLLSVGVHRFAPLFGLTSFSLHPETPASGFNRFFAFDQGYDVSGITAIMSFFTSELELVIRSVDKDAMLYLFAVQVLSVIDGLYQRIDLRETIALELDDFALLIQNYKSRMETAVEWGFAERYEAFIAYLRSTNCAYQHDPEGAPKQSGASYLSLSLPAVCREGTSINPEDGKGVLLAREAALRLGQCIDGVYATEFDPVKNLLSSLSGLSCQSALVSERQESEHQRFATIFLNGHAFAEHALIASDFIIKAWAKTLSPAQQAAIISQVAAGRGFLSAAGLQGLSDWFFGRIKSISDLTGWTGITFSQDGVPNFEGEGVFADEDMEDNPILRSADDLRGPSEDRSSELLAVGESKDMQFDTQESKQGFSSPYVQSAGYLSIAANPDEENSVGQQ